MKIRKLFLIPVAALCLLMTACSNTTDPADLYKGESAEQIFQKGEEALRDKNYQEATKRFEALDVQYPLGRNTETAQLQIIYAYYMSSEMHPLNRQQIALFMLILPALMLIMLITCVDYRTIIKI